MSDVIELLSSHKTMVILAVVVLIYGVFRLSKALDP